MKAIIHPSALKGHLHAPASKSSMQRALAAALIKKGETFIHNPGHSNDDKAAIDIIKTLGAEIAFEGDDLKIRSYSFASDTYQKASNNLPLSIDCGESGLSIRMFTPIVALSNQEFIITGQGSLVSRPMQFFDEILPKLGVSIKTNHSLLPMNVKGPLKPANIEVDGSLSSQFLTGLLMAYSAAGANNVSIKVKELKSKPYIDLTLAVMKEFRLPIPVNKNYEEFIFTQPSTLIPIAIGTPFTTEYTVESDWSNAAFLLVAGAIAGPVMINGLDLSSTQGDKSILDALMSCNAALAIEAKGIKIRPAEMNGFEFDATDCPDLFPPLVALATVCKGVTFIKGVSRLKHKESDRAAALKKEFGKMGVKLEISDDIMKIHGLNKIKGAIVQSHHDHRIAMALAITALVADGVTEIEDAGAVNKSYPDFFDDLKKLGAGVSLDNKYKLHE